MHDKRDAILAQLDVDQGVTAVSMGWLRKQYEPEWERLSAGRAAEISSWLAKREIRHLPSPLPSREIEEVLLYKPSSHIGVYISAARLEGPFEHQPAAAAYILRNLCRQPSSATTDGDA